MPPKKAKLPANQPQPPCLGDAVEILWPDENRYYRGVLRRKNQILPYNFLIFYDDDDREIVDLDEEHWRYARPTHRTKSRTHFRPGDVTRLWPHGRPTLAWSDPTVVAARLSKRQRRGKRGEEESEEVEDGASGDQGAEESGLKDESMQLDANPLAERDSLPNKERLNHNVEEAKERPKEKPKAKPEPELLETPEADLTHKPIEAGVAGSKAANMPSVTAMQKRKAKVADAAGKVSIAVPTPSRKTPTHKTRSSVRKQKRPVPQILKQESKLLRALVDVAASERRRVSFRSGKAA